MAGRAPASRQTDRAQHILARWLDCSKHGRAVPSPPTLPPASASPRGLQPCRHLRAVCGQCQ